MQHARLALKAAEFVKGSTEHYLAQYVLVTLCLQKLEVTNVPDAIGAASVVRTSPPTVVVAKLGRLWLPMLQGIHAKETVAVMLIIACPVFQAMPLSVGSACLGIPPLQVFASSVITLVLHASQTL